MAFVHRTSSVLNCDQPCLTCSLTHNDDDLIGRPVTVFNLARSIEYFLIWCPYVRNTLFVRAFKKCFTSLLQKYLGRIVVTVKRNQHWLLFGLEFGQDQKQSLVTKSDALCNEPCGPDCTLMYFIVWWPWFVRKLTVTWDSSACLWCVTVFDDLDHGWDCLIDYVQH